MEHLQDARSSYFYRDSGSIVKPGAVHLADGGRADGCMIEFQVKLLGRMSKLFHEDSGNLFAAAGGNTVQQGEQRIAVFLGQNVDLQGHDLSQLEKGTADFFEAFTQEEMPL